MTDFQAKVDKYQAVEHEWYRTNHSALPKQLKDSLTDPKEESDDINDLIDEYADPTPE